MVSPDRFAKGMTFDQYVAFISTPENLKREGSFNRPRKDYGDFFRQAYEHDYLTFSMAPFMALTAAAGLRDLWERPKLKLAAAGLAVLALLQAAWVNGDRLTRMGGNLFEEFWPDVRRLLKW